MDHIAGTAPESGQEPAIAFGGTHRTGRFRGRAAGSVEARSLQNPLTTSRIEHGPRCALRPTCDLRDVRMGTQRQGRSVACPVYSAYLGDGGSSQSPV